MYSTFSIQSKFDTCANFPTPTTPYLSPPNFIHVSLSSLTFSHVSLSSPPSLHGRPPSPPPPRPADHRLLPPSKPNHSHLSLLILISSSQHQFQIPNMPCFWSRFPYSFSNTPTHRSTLRSLLHTNSHFFSLVVSCGASIAGRADDDGDDEDDDWSWMEKREGVERRRKGRGG